MFDYISGVLKRKSENYAVIDANGIGYKITMPAQSLAHLGDIENIATIYTYLYIREDIIELYGFSSPEERTSFEMLISVSGVGPKAAISILSSVPFSSLALAIVTNDPKTITKAQGVGPKLAQRIILELKDKIKSRDLTVSDSDFTPDVSLDDEAIEALVVLGYSRSEAENALKNVPGDASLEERIKSALTGLMKF